MVILKPRGTLEEVIKEANLPYDYEQLSGMIEAGPWTFHDDKSA